MRRRPKRAAAALHDAARSLAEARLVPEVAEMAVNEPERLAVLKQEIARLHIEVVDLRRQLEGARRPVRRRLFLLLRILRAAIVWLRYVHATRILRRSGTLDAARCPPADPRRRSERPAPPRDDRVATPDAALPAEAPTSSRAARTPDDAQAGAGRRVCVFSHYDRKGRILGYVRRYIEALARQRFEVYVVSTSARLDDRDRAAVESGNVRVHIRENRGRDFGSWQWALREIPALAEADTLLFANDSVFGPLFDFGEVLAAMEAEPVDFWGITDSFDVRWHLQSYFLCLSRRAHRSQAFLRVFAQDFASIADKRSIIERGEIALSQALIAEGLVARAYCPYERFLPDPSPGNRFNPTHHFWDRLIIEQRCPFMKRELFHTHSPGNGRIAPWRAVIEGFADYDSTLIDEYLEHAGIGRHAQSGAR